MGKSVKRDIYLARAISKSDKDQQQLMKFLAISPYSQHKKMAKAMLDEVQKLREQNSPTEA